MRILIVSQYFKPENLTINHVVKLMHLNGHHVEVLTGKPNYPEGKFFKGFGFFSKIKNKEDFMVYRVPILPRGKKFKSITLGLNYLSFVISASFLSPFLMRKRKYDVVFVYGVSPILKTLPAILMGKIKGIPVILWVQDLWPDSIKASNYNIPTFLLSFLERLINYIYSNVDLILCQSKSFVKEIEKKEINKKVDYLPNVIDSVFQEPLKEYDSVKDTFNDYKDSFNILFTGNIGEAQSIETLIDAIQIVNGKTENRANLIILGDGSKLDFFKKMVKKNKIQNVHFLGHFPIEYMPHFISLCDSLVVSLKSERIFALTIPNKVQSYLASAKPILAAMDGEGAEIIKKSFSGYSSSAEDAEQLAYNIELLLNNSHEERSQLGRNGLKYFYENFSDESFIAKLNYFLEQSVVLHKGK